MAVTMKYAVFWDVTPYIVFLRRVGRMLVTVNVVPSAPILVILIMEELRSSETRTPFELVLYSN
jgi:hypothetical protein